MAKKINISQSLIKSLDEYFFGDECGHLIYRMYSQEIYREPTELQALGHYFEYQATGTLPKDGKTPEPVLLKNGGLSSKYRIANEQAELFKELCDKMNITILKTGETKVKNGLAGTRDLQADWNGKKVTIDLKYSGLVNNEYEALGWGNMYGENTRRLQYNLHSTQSKQYQYIFDDPFFFWVFSSVNVGETIIIEMEHDQQDIDSHLERAKEAKKRWGILAGHNQIGISARPEYNKCKKCILYNSCDYKAELPIPKKPV